MSPAERVLKDRRDAPFLVLMAKASVIQLPFAITLFALAHIPLWLACAYFMVMMRFLGPVILMIHNVSHRPPFREGYGILDVLIQCVLGPLVGQTPYTYRAHHLGMHH